MIYSDVKSLFQSILNRRDITNSQIESFIDLGMRRAQRSLRVPSMEAIGSYVVADPYYGIPVPNDLLELISIDTYDNPSQPRKLEKVDLQEAMILAINPGIPLKFARRGAFYIVGPEPSPDTTFYVRYYQAIPAFTGDTSSNWLSNVAPDILVYGALSFAADFFLDDRREVFENRFAQAMDELQGQAEKDELAGAFLSPTYSMEEQSL